MFIGLYQHAIDKKNRLFIPAKFRLPGKGRNKKFVLTCGLEGCLFLYPREAWLDISKKFRTLPLTKKDARQFLRIFLAGACECGLDIQGRILIPKNLIDYAKIKRNVAILGLVDRVEIWANEEWKKYHQSSKSRFSDVAEKLTDLGI